MKRIIASVLIIIIMLSMAGCCLKHEWLPATCTAPKTCSSCGETEGSPLGHEWIEATCTTPKTCSRCLKTEGDVAEHRFGQWKVSNKATYFDEGKNVRTCSVCGYEESEYTDKLDIISKFPYSKERFDSKGYFTFNTEELAALVDYYLPTSYTVTYNNSDGKGQVYKNDGLVSVFSTDKTWIICLCASMDTNAGDVLTALVQAASINAGKSDAVNLISTMEWLDEGTSYAYNDDIMMYMGNGDGGTITFGIATVKFAKGLL